MTSVVGQGLALVALFLCAFGTPIGFVAGARRSAVALKLARRLALAFAGVMLAANLLMEYALVTHDFSVSYVAQVGSRATPLHITIVSLWSSLEGSILFWGLVLGLYTAAVAVLQRRGHEDYLGYTLGTLLAIGLFFSFMIAGPASPFRPTPPPVPSDGPGPNPLLQNHLLMIVHPPMLYLGYVGMSVPFAMAVAALLRGQLGPTWLKPLRNSCADELSDPRHHAGRLVELRGARMGRLLGLGSGGERLLSALADGGSGASFGGRPAAARHVEGLDGDPGDDYLPADHPGDLPDPLGGGQLGALVHPEPHRSALPGLPGHRSGGHGGAAGVAGREPGLGAVRGLDRGARGCLPAQQPVAGHRHVHGPRGDPLPDRRGGRPRRQGERRRAVLQPHVGAGVSRSVVAHGRRPGSSLGPLESPAARPRVDRAVAGRTGRARPDVSPRSADTFCRRRSSPATRCG